MSRRLPTRWLSRSVSSSMAARKSRTSSPPTRHVVGAQARHRRLYRTRMVFADRATPHSRAPFAARCLPPERRPRRAQRPTPRRCGRRPSRRAQPRWRPRETRRGRGRVRLARFERVVRGREEQVDQTDRHDGRHRRRPHAADRGRRDDNEQVEQQRALDRQVVAHGQEAGGQKSEPGCGHNSTETLAARRQPCRPGPPDDPVDACHTTIFGHGDDHESRLGTGLDEILTRRWLLLSNALTRVAVTLRRAHAHQTDADRQAAGHLGVGSSAAAEDDRARDVLVRRDLLDRIRHRGDPVRHRGRRVQSRPRLVKTRPLGDRGRDAAGDRPVSYRQTIFSLPERRWVLHRQPREPRRDTRRWSPGRHCWSTTS